MVGRIKLILAGFIVALFIPSWLTAAELVFGRAPQLSPDVTIRDWTPLVNYLSEQTGHKIKLKVYSARTAFEEDLVEGKLDLFYGNPGYAVVGHRLHGYIPLVRSNNRKLQGIVTVRADSGITDLRQLDKKTIGFPFPTAFAASLYLAASLRDEQGLEFEEQYFDSHDNVYRNVLVGTVKAGGGIYRTLNREPKALREQLRVIYETPGLKPHPIVAHPRVSPELRKAITDAILNLSSSEEGASLLKILTITQPVVADYATDYKPIEPMVTKMYHYLLGD